MDIFSTTGKVSMDDTYNAYVIIITVFVTPLSAVIIDSLLIIARSSLPVRTAARGLSLNAHICYSDRCDWYWRDISMVSESRRLHHCSNRREADTQKAGRWQPEGGIEERNRLI